METSTAAEDESRYVKSTERLQVSGSAEREFASFCECVWVGEGASAVILMQPAARGNRSDHPTA